jgi:two-component sensor histidine kinase
VNPSMPVPDRNERTLLRELSHRIDKELLCSINTVSAAAVRTDNPEIKVALSSVVDLVQQQATVHRLLTIPDGDGLVDAAGHIRELGLAMSRSCLEPTGIGLAVVADTLPLESERCWRAALVVHELVLNAARHACFDDRDGVIKVKLSLTESVVNCIVADNGSLSARLKPGRGLQMVSDLAKSLGGRVEYRFGAQFSSVLLVFPLTERERRANRVVALRRSRGARQRKATPRLDGHSAHQGQKLDGELSRRNQDRLPLQQPLDALFGITPQLQVS